jgi:hypothetical protein
MMNSRPVPAMVIALRTTVASPVSSDAGHTFGLAAVQVSFGSADATTRQ